VADAEFVSTGTLPDRGQVRRLLDDAHRRFAVVNDGSLSAVYPALAAADANHFGLCIVSTAGAEMSCGDDQVPFTIMSAAKPFVMAVVCDLIGPEQLRRRVGVNATGLPFNSAEAVERSPHGRTNPMVNPGAIVTTSLVPGGDLEARWEFLRGRMSELAGHDLAVDDAVYASARTTNHRNRSLADLLHSKGALVGDPDDAVELYTRQSCLAVTVRELATLGATLANGGANPLSGRPIVSAATAHDVLAVMATAGLYETSGDWLWDVGLPGKSGISGAIVVVSPGKGGLGVYSPLLDATGNSVRGQLAATYLSHQLGLDLFASRPTPNPHGRV
jgi:glutaminase